MPEPTPPPTRTVSVRACSSLGRVRRRNEDHVGFRAGSEVTEPDADDEPFGIDDAPTPTLVVVTDGLGGHPGGDIASRSAVRALLDLAPGSPAELVDAVLAANERLHDEMNEATSGMGTTLAAVLVHDDGVVVVNVGDSPVFVLERDTSPPELVQLTVDDVPAAEVSRSGMVTQSLGGFDRLDAVDVHLHEDDHPAPRRLLVCTDGLSGFVPGDVISLVLDSLEDPAEVVRTLVELADAAGGLDNCTVAVIDVR